MMRFLFFQVLLAASALFGGITTATPTAATLEACNDIASAVSGILSYPTDQAYKDEVSLYWSTRLRDLSPACVARPLSAENVSAIVKILNNYPDVQFAVKSGGHDPNPGHSSIQDGILIAMREISGATYDSSTNLASVKPGGDWDTVIGDLATSKVAIVGGRLGIVGVGGYLLQGGISFLSAQYGLAADNIVAWETVMANGSIVTVNSTTQPDLAVAMRGGGGQFGIVTEFTVLAKPVYNVWGGFRFYTTDVEAQLFAALHNFVENGAQDPKAAIIFTSLALVDGAEAHLIFYFYDGPSPPTTGPFADFLGISSLLSLTYARTYADLLSSNGQEGGLLSERVAFRTYTVPYIASFPGMYSLIRDKWVNITAPFLSNILHATSQCSVDFQPVPSAVGAQSELRGGNAIGFTGSDPDRLFLELECTWVDAADDAIHEVFAQEMTDWLDEQVPQWLAAAGLDCEYLPYFMNDAMGDQNVTQSYKGYETYKALQKSVDPEGLWYRAGGFKF